MKADRALQIRRWIIKVMRSCVTADQLDNTIVLMMRFEELHPVDDVFTSNSLKIMNITYDNKLNQLQQYYEES